MAKRHAERNGEAIDKRGLSRFLRGELGLRVQKLAVEQFKTGSSNLTYRIEVDSSEYVLRRPPFGNVVRSAHDMYREYRVLTKVSEVFDPAPKPVAYCADPSVLGSEFFLMELRRGRIIRGRLPEEIERSVELRQRCVDSFVDCLARIHMLDIDSSGLRSLGEPKGYVERQVVGWSERYFGSKTEGCADLERSIEWLNQSIPRDDTASLVHNDYKFDNLMFSREDPARIVAVLDWEMATVGSPLMDLGTALGYWMSKEAGEEFLEMPFNPGRLMRSFSRWKIAGLYSAKTGADISGLLYYYVFGLVKIAVIAQQIHSRFLQGHTRDPRFAGFGRLVRRLGSISQNAIRKGCL